MHTVAAQDPAVAMVATRFESRPLPRGLGGAVRGRLRAAHRREPFSALDARATVRRVSVIVAALGLQGVVYRGGVDLRGWEVDHVWVALGDRVLDVSFPLFDGEFVDVLRAFVSGDVGAQAVTEAAAAADLDARVLGEFPDRLEYLGRPVWNR